jgi:uncharacterized protein (TIGR03086 family)
MLMDAKQLFAAALDQATVVIDKVTPEDMQSHTPDTEWNVRKLANHMLYELCWVADIVQGKTIAAVGDAYKGDLIGHALAANWHAAAAQARDAVAQAVLQDTAHVSYGDISVDEYLRQVGVDVLIHAWDLGEGIAIAVHFAPELAQASYDFLTPQASDMAASGLFAAPVTVPANADIQTKLLALTGRRQDWQI